MSIQTRVLRETTGDNPDNSGWYIKSIPHWWFIDACGDEVHVTYWRWTGHKDDSARFWVARVASERDGRRLARDYYCEGLGLDTCDVAREYCPNVSMPKLADMAHPLD